MGIQRRPEHSKQALLALTVLFISIFLLLALAAMAAPTTEAQARLAVATWLRWESRPLGSGLGQQVKSVEAFRSELGGNAYYVVYLEPRGFVVVSGDDMIEPIIAFVAEGRYDPSENDPLGALVTRDLRGRIAEVRGSKPNALDPAQHARFEQARSKWTTFLTGDQRLLGIMEGIPGPLSDERIAPIVQSKWSQDTASGGACYNYYTPPGQPGSANNYVCGCVATAMAQVMRYYQHPTTGVGTASYMITVNGTPQSRALRGGNGSGGPYDYASMPLNPAASASLQQRQAIGALCHDAGVAAHMMYAADGSGAYLDDANEAMLTVFGYGNSIFGFNNGNNIGAALNTMLNPGLDAGYPSILGIIAPSGGHAIVCDGYGYNGATMYHHLNLGWAGAADAWYNLPTVDTGYITFTSVTDCLYNLYVSGSGEIISGQVTDNNGNPVAGVAVSATRTGGGNYSATTNARGIYALAKIPSNSQYTVAAQKEGYVFAPQTVTTGKSSDRSNNPGNKWGINFKGQSAWKCSGDVPKSIPDANPSGVESTISVQESGIVSDVDVKLTIQHSRVSDLTVTLVSPDGTIVQLFNNVGGVGSNFTDTVLDDEASTAIGSGSAPFTGSFRPASPLTAFDGKSTSGVWRLKVVDNTSGTAGSLTAWCLRFSTGGDNDPPTCTVTAPPGLTNVSPINFTITFSEPVTGLTAAKVTVTGGAKGALTGSGANYTLPVTPSGNGEVRCFVPAGSAQDGAGNNNLASNTASVIYDGTRPSVTVNQAAVQADPTSSQSIKFTAIFSEPVTGFAADDVTIGGTAGATTAAVTGSGMTYTITVTGMTQSGTVTASIPADRASDEAGNLNTASTSADNTVTFDNSALTCTVTAPTGPTRNTPLSFTIKFSRAVSGLVPSDMVITNGTAGALTGSARDYTLAVVPSADGTVSCRVPDGAAQDSEGNSNTASNTASVVYDGTGPTVAVDKAPGQADPTLGSPIRFLVGFTEPVTDFTASDVTIGGTAGATKAIVTGSGVSYEVTVSGMTSQGTVTVKVLANAAHDAAGNGNSASNTASVVFDGVPPTCVVTAPASPASVSPLEFVIEFSVPVTGLALDDIAVTGGNKTELTGNGTDYLLKVVPTGDGVVTCQVVQGAAQDAQGNINVASNEASVTYDVTGPAVTINQAGDQLDPTSRSTIGFTAVFSEPVTGFTAEDVVIGGTAGATTAVVTGSGTTYQVAVSGMTAYGTVTASMPANKAHDAAGNGNSASVSTDNTVTYVPLGCVITSPAGVTRSWPVNLTITFAKAVTGFTTDGVAVSGAVKGTLAGSGAVYTLPVMPIADGAATCQVIAGAAVDEEGNFSKQSNLASIAFDGTPPLVSITTPTAEPSYATGAGTLDMSGTASDTGGLAGITWSNNRGGSGSAATSGASWSASGIVLSLGRNVITVVATDSAGNSSSDTLTVTYADMVAPIITIESPTSEPECCRNTPVLNITGTASDDVAIASITWANDRGGSGTCAGTTVWSATGINLQSGRNVITVTASDPTGNKATDTIAVTYVYAQPGVAWQRSAMVSLPIIPDFADPKRVTGFDQSGWCTYDAVSRSYTTYPERATWFDPADLTPGRGFWAQFATNWIANPTGMVPPQNEAKSIRLMPGWNLIGQPFILPVRWSRTAIMVREPGQAPKSLLNAGDVVADYIWGWNSRVGAYYMVCDQQLYPTAVGTMDPWQAYWIRAFRECDLILPAP